MIDRQLGVDSQLVIDRQLVIGKQFFKSTLAKSLSLYRIGAGLIWITDMFVDADSRLKFYMQNLCSSSGRLDEFMELWIKLCLLFSKASIAILILSGCATHKAGSDGAIEGEVAAVELNKDPYEKYNRAVFRFNDGLDRALLKPVAKGYRFIAPKLVETGVTNFFSNLGEVKNVVNDLLQGKVSQAGNDSGRFIVNSTVGVAGLFDVAKHTGLKKSDGEDFGQTLRVWGVPEGPYLVIPFVGSSTCTDIVGYPVDWLTNPLTYVDESTEKYAVIGLQLIDARKRLLDAEELVSGDRYIFIREAYLQNRRYLTNDGEIEDDFSEGFEDFEDF